MTAPHVPLNCKALFFRDADRGDLMYQQGLADLLVERGVLSDDVWIQGWDGSRMALDRENPRVELDLTPLSWVGPEVQGDQRCAPEDHHMPPGRRSKQHAEARQSVQDE